MQELPHLGNHCTRVEEPNVRHYFLFSTRRLSDPLMIRKIKRKMITDTLYRQGR